MSVNLTSYTSIQANNFVRIDVPDYSILRFSDYHRDYTIDGESYTGLGTLLGLSDNVSELRITNQEMTISLAGIPITRVSEILDNKITGSAIRVYRNFFNASTGAALAIAGNPITRFSGVITNYSIQDEIAEASSDEAGTITLTLTAASLVEVLSQKLAGRRTNPVDQKRYYPTDISMDRVPTIARSQFNFGGAQ
jgi:hypothetical protein